MPVRFRCPHCNRLLGIARRKAGTQINCPQCNRMLSVPPDDKNLDLDEIDLLVNPAATENGMVHPQAKPSSPAAVSTLPPPVIPTPAPIPPPAARSPQPRSAAKQSTTPRESPLLERDVDSLLGLDRGLRFDLDEEAEPKKVAASGMDAMSLGDEPKGLVLSPQKATLLGIAVLVLLGIAFAAGFLVASNL